MAKHTKYLIAANGTFHLRNPKTGNSWCGRVRPGDEGVKATNREPEPPRDKVCGRSAQLAAGAERSAAVTDASTPATGTPKVRKTRQKAVQPVSGGRPGNALTEDGAVYDAIVDLLDHNDIKAVTNYDLAGVSLIFDNGDWRYQIWAPEWNANGPDEGWVVTYSVDGGDDGYAEPMSTVTDVMAWLVDDMELQPLPERKQKASALHSGKSDTKPVSTVVIPDSSSTKLGLVSSHLVSVQSNAAAARELAVDSDMPADFLKALRALEDAAKNLRKKLIDNN